MYVVILAGGSGTRFWPLSRTKTPKQLMSVFGGKSMLQRTVERVLPLAPKRIMVVTNSLQAEETARQLADLGSFPVDVIEENGAPSGEKHFILYNPPLVDASLGLRKSSLLEGVRLARDLLTSNVQSVVFARSRRSVEIVLRYLQGNQSVDSSIESPLIEYDSLPSLQSAVRGYRSGYLPTQRREIEKGLRDGSVKLVVATNALELGIDIGSLDVCIMTGYPGNVASTWQQAGRAGRGPWRSTARTARSPGPRLPPGSGRSGCTGSTAACSTASGTCRRSVSSLSRSCRR